LAEVTRRWIDAGDRFDPDWVRAKQRAGFMRSRSSAFSNALVLGVALCGLAIASCARTQAIDSGTGGSGGGGDDAGDMDAAVEQPPPDTLANGQPCTVDGPACTSGFCVDGVCCATACADVCYSCATEASAGICVPSAVGTDPRDDCDDEGVASCGHDGTCDGSGACRRYPIGVICRGQTCAGSTRTNASRCDSAGSCRPTSGQPCDPYQCDATGNDCRSTCGDSSDCIAGTFCDGDSCGKKPLGAACTGGEDCNSAICAQGVCCNTQCSGTCQSCALSGSTGTCTDVPSGEDPLEQCDTTAPTGCGTDGTCDGQGSCRRYAAGTVCKDPTCAGATGTPQGRCDGAGTCAVGPPITCGTCQVCTLTAAAPICSLVPAGLAPVVAGQCATQAVATCGTDGTCDGNGACRFYANATVCMPGTCPTGATRTPARLCNGAGSCLAAASTTCPGGFLCDAANNACKTTCTVATSAADCLAPNVCTGTICGSIRLLYSNRGVAGATTQGPSQHFQLINLGAAAVPLGDLTIRYWYTADGTGIQQAAIDFASNGAGVIQTSVTALFTPVTRVGADTVLQLGFTAAAGALGASGGSAIVESRFNNTSFKAYTQTGDYSFDPTKTLPVDWTHVTLYRQGTLIWGIEPPAP
jgi:hypothetical protein